MSRTALAAAALVAITLLACSAESDDAAAANQDLSADAEARARQFDALDAYGKEIMRHACKTHPDQAVREKWPCPLDKSPAFDVAAAPSRGDPFDDHVKVINRAPPAQLSPRSSMPPSAAAAAFDAAPNFSDSLLDGSLVHDIESYSCTSAQHRFRPYFPGIQAFDDDDLLGILGILGGDRATADFYTKFAVRSFAKPLFSFGEPAHLATQWSLLYYYNRPTANDALTSAFLDDSRSDVQASQRGVFSRHRDNRATLRMPKRSSRMAWGDQLETRLLGAWASAAPEKFVAMDAAFPESAAGDRADFALFRSQIAQSTEWRSFLQRAAFEAAVSFKCGTPLYAHSGGGSVVAFVARLLDTHPSIHRQIETWPVASQNRRFVIVGLEAVLSNEFVALANAGAYGGRLIVKNYIVGDHGSDTWRDPIEREIREVGATPIDSIGVEGANPPGWNGDGAGHGGLGFYALMYGQLPGQSFPVP